MSRFTPPSSRSRVYSRRRFLEHLLATGAVTAGGVSLAGCRSSDDESPLGSGTSPGTTAPLAEEASGRLLPGAAGDRVLVVVDLQGGNDGLSTLVPYASGTYHDLRPTLAVPDEDVLALDDEVGLHPSLSRLFERGITTVEGVGPVDGDLSHFDMVARWERGDVGGTEMHLRSGFLGRLTDALDDGSPLVGVALGSPTPHLTNQRAATISLSSAHELWFLQHDEWSEPLAFQEHLTSLGGDHPLTRVAISSYEQLLGLARKLPESSDDPDWEDPMVVEGGELGRGLLLAADLIDADVGTRVVYVGMSDYDTHANHQYRQEANLAQVDVAVDGFLSMVEEQGRADQVLVATISEFGRRVPENGTGLDHGSASTMLLAGPVGDVRAGDRPSVDDLDEDDNLRTTVPFDRYLATLAEEWLGVEAASVLSGEPQPLGLL